MWSFFNSCVSLIVLLLNSSSALSPLWDSVKTNVHQEYDVKEGNNQVWVVRMNMGEYKGLDLVVGEDIRPDSRIILTCTAWYPAEWVYSGDGKPEFTTNTTIENLSSDVDALPLSMPEDMNGAKRYVATLTVGKNRLKTTDTGRYNCMTASPETGMKYKTLSAFYHLYVPGGDLFIREGAETIYYDLRKSPARIPCGVTSPKTAVSLQKFEKGNLKFVPNGSMFYHPISGYYPKLEIPGTYICTAGFNHTYKLIHFTLVPASDLGSSYLQSQKFNKRKPSQGTRKPEELEWLMFATPTKNRTTSKKPRPRPTLSPSDRIRSTTPYVPFHIRYTSTYEPFYTFQDSVEYSSSRPPYKKNPLSWEKRPFNPSEYPSDLVTKESTKRPSLSNPTQSISSTIYDFFDQKLQYSPPTSGSGSSKPLFNYFKDSPKPSSIDLGRPTFPGFGNKKRPMESTTFRTRTTPRTYRPKKTSTTKTTILIPQQVICSQVSCGINAECIVINVFYSTTNQTLREAACKCSSNYTGNPYLECRPPMMDLDENFLYFNSSFRSPIKLQLQSNHGRPDEELSSETEGITSLPVHIIDM